MAGDLAPGGHVIYTNMAPDLIIPDCMAPNLT